MPTRDLHQKPFDSGTLSKLELFKYTAKGFLGVFIASGQYTDFKVNIFDFFCGPGINDDGQEGSCIQLLQELHHLQSSIDQNKICVEIFLNDADAKKIISLENNLEKLNLREGPYQIRTASKKFLSVFASETKRMEKANTCNLVLIDQNGVKQFPPEVFEKLRQLKRTDFMVFMSSSHAWRYQDAPAMKRYLETKKAFGDNVPFYDTHRAIVNYYRTLIPENLTFHLAPFSIKKGSNIHGVIFGSSSLKGMEKFLEAAWKLDGQRGEDNYDIDREGMINNPGELSLDFGPVSKERDFQHELKEAVRFKSLRSNADIYRFTIEAGFLAKHARKALDELTNEGFIDKITGVAFKATKNPTPITFR